MRPIMPRRLPPLQIMSVTVGAGVTRGRMAPNYDENPTLDGSTLCQDWSADVKYDQYPISHYGRTVIRNAAL